ncbi:MAG TPA: carboxymuconolactone decarboxylase family protein, partial [Phnomibacter sp.]|nr:carboxymuconolactone decarboxylase family protein [Phnomibacter sp.]
MPHIHLPEGVPGIRSLALYRPDTGAQLYQLVQVLLRGPSPLSPAERELIAAYVSKLNNCSFCTLSHAAAARCLYADETGLVTEVLNNPNTAPISQLMKRLLHIAGKVQVLGSQVQPADIEAARQAGA